jgi:hypothetical protein
MEKSVIDQQKEDEIKKAAEFSGTSPKVIEAGIAISEGKEDLAEAKKDLAMSKGLVKDAQFKV